MTQEGWAASPRSLSSPASPRYGVDTHVPTREHLGRCAHLTQRTGEGWPTAPDTPPHIPKATLVSPQTPETSTGQFTCYENRTFSLATDTDRTAGTAGRLTVSAGGFSVVRTFEAACSHGIHPRHRRRPPARPASRSGVPAGLCAPEPGRTRRSSCSVGARFFSSRSRP
jgi:hypothetical protein